MALLKAKQIDKLLGTLRRFDSAFTLAAAATVSLAATFAGKTAGGNDTTAGVFTTAPYNKVVLIDESTGNPLTDGVGNNVYGRIDGAFLCTFYIVLAGVETAYTFLAGNVSIGNTVAVIYGESVQFKDVLATDVIHGMDHLDETDYDARAHAEKIETLPVTVGGQTAFTLTETPKAASVKIFVNGQRESTFTHVGTSTAVTWLNTDYQLETTDEVTFIYNF